MKLLRYFQKELCFLFIPGDLLRFYLDFRGHNAVPSKRIMVCENFASPSHRVLCRVLLVLTAIHLRADCERWAMSRPDTWDVGRLRRLHSIYKFGWAHVILCDDTHVSYRDTAAFCISGVGAAVMSLTTSAISSLGFCIIWSFEEL